MSKHRAPAREDWDLVERQHRIAKVLANIIIPLGIFTLVGILAGLAIAEVIM